MIAAIGVKVRRGEAGVGEARGGEEEARGEGEGAREEDEKSFMCRMQQLLS